MNIYYNVIETGAESYVECGSEHSSLRTEQDALELVTACRENETSLLMLHADSLSEDFFKQTTGVADQTLRLLSNDRVKTAIVIPDDFTIEGEFNELDVKSLSGDGIGVFDNRIDAERWLIDI
ncbi:DUF4180 domain-containing protein [Cohnella lupini]|nr:DUF4180 domain-containing protein [Cohnella lupini]